MIFSEHVLECDFAKGGLDDSGLPGSSKPASLPYMREILTGKPDPCLLVDGLHYLAR